MGGDSSNMDEAEQVNGYDPLLPGEWDLPG